MPDRYEIKSTLGHGGMGTVYHAFDTVMKRDVALKRLLPIEETHLNEAADDSLKREAAALARFSHPNIVTIYAFEEDEEGPFVVMEMVDGEDLKGTVKRGALGVEDFVELAEQTLDPLIAANELNLLHRDIKPANIMLNWLPTGKFQAKILDFGLAKFSEKPQMQTLDQKGFFLGSIDYLTPDQLLCLPLDQRSDLYSLGCVLYFCLAQEAPFHGKNPADTTDRHMNHTCENILEVRPDLPAPLGDWLMRMIARERDDRPDDARMALKEFFAAKEGRSPLSRTEGSGQKSVVVVSGKGGGSRTDEPVSIGLEDVVEEEVQPVVTVNTEPQMVLVGDKMQRTGPTKIYTGPIKTYTGPQKTHTGPLGGTAPIQAPKATPQLLRIFMIVGGVALVLGLLVALLKGGKDDEKSVVKVAVVPKPKPKPAHPKYKPTFKPLPSTQFMTPVGKDLPAPKTIPSGPPPVTDGLFGHYQGGVATFGPDLKSPAEVNDRVAGWANLVPGIEPQNDLFLHSSDYQVQSVPRLLDVTEARFPELKPGGQVLDFQNSSHLKMPNYKSLKLKNQASTSVVAVVRAESKPKSESAELFRIYAKRGTFNLAYMGGKIFRGYSYETKSPIMTIPLAAPQDEFAIVSFVLDGAAKFQQTHVMTAAGKRTSSKPASINLPPAEEFRYYSLGYFWRPQMGVAQPRFFKGQVAEVLFFSKALTKAERESLENYLHARNFK